MQLSRSDYCGVSPLRRQADGSPLRGNCGPWKRHYGRGRHRSQSLHLWDEDGNVEMVDVQEDHQVRHTPYSTQERRSVKWHEENKIHVTVWKDRRRLKREMEENTQNGALGDWFKISIPFGRMFDKQWLLSSLQRRTSIPFTPVDFHYVKNRAQFFVQGVHTASALKTASHRLYDEKKQKISIYAAPSEVPYSVRNKLEEEEMKQLELTMKRRYDISKQALDLQRLHFDPDFMGHGIDIVLGRRNCMSAVLQIIEKEFPKLSSLNLCDNRLQRLDGLSEVTQKAPMIKILNLSNNELRTTWEVSKMKGLKLEELWLEGNPLCDTFRDHSAYVSAIRDCFPMLLRLDGQEFTAPITVEVESSELIKPCQESYKGPEVLKDLVQQFLQEYYSIYDYGDRQGLLAAYHDECCFSLSIHSHHEDPALGSLCELYKESRNMKTLKDPFLRVQLLKHTKQDVVRSLCLLPKTQHDFNSLVVDMWVQMKTMLCFSVYGVFKEVDGISQGSVRAFTRIFIATPGNNSGLCIVNDVLLVRNATASEAQRAFPTPVPTPTSSSLPILSQLQQEMVQAFSTQSGMKLDWSLKCLQDNDWNYTRAGEIFIKFKMEGKIPKEAFQ
ncbi:nuclear RNA export factor 2-like isoform X2 [Erinaceus europaeus]|uniref:Nuclear RNA export factor 2-like isoform X2 n=1 Tax=Erinaceus europaeus TaxID=9365 RepID=A0ABM3WRH4_ERIEU|nr:nuclear RNA export factor 2-like isoform X2 [Erinaceus europaeus]